MPSSRITKSPCHGKNTYTHNAKTYEFLNVRLKGESETRYWYKILRIFSFSMIFSSYPEKEYYLKLAENGNTWQLKKKSRLSIYTWTGILSCYTTSFWYVEYYFRTKLYESMVLILCSILSQRIKEYKIEYNRQKLKIAAEEKCYISNVLLHS